MTNIRAGIAAAAMLCLLAGPAAAQIAPARTIDELKAETQARADRDAYPLTGLKPAEVRDALAHIDSLDRDQWAVAWGAVAERHMALARTAEAAGQRPQASAEYLAAWRLYSFARWPTPNSPGKAKAYQLALEAFRNHARLMDPAPETIRIPFEGGEIVGYLRLPGVRPAPVVLTISALDSRKEDNIDTSDAFIQRGIGVFALDMPGTGEAPLKGDVGAERMFSRAIDFLVQRPEIDPHRIAVQGGSWGGHWSALLGFTERARLKAAVVQGGPVDGYFQPEWQTKALGTREYLYDLFPARVSVYGVTTLADFLAYGPRLSLKNGDLIDQPSAPMLLVNGARDTQVPISDLDLLLHHGSPKEAWLNPAGGHMGRSADWPDTRIYEQIVVPWLARQLAPAAD